MMKSAHFGRNPMRVITNQSGLLTVDWLFGFILVMGFTALLFSLCMTLTVVEVTQYMTFASARNYHAAHFNEGRQRELALRKFNQLRNNRVYGAFFSGDWFELDQDPFIGPADRGSGLQAYGSQSDQFFLFYGTGINLNAKILDFNIPFFGETLSEDDNPNGFKSYISSYLGRESTINECLNFNDTRWEAIRLLDSAYNSINGSVQYFSFPDNGC